jgi:flagellar biosynthesis/type III secretory pathway chaperone
MSVQMNYPMVQYLRQALKNDANVIQELDRLLAPSSNAITVHKKVEENMLQLVQQKGIYLVFY